MMHYLLLALWSLVNTPTNASSYSISAIADSGDGPIYIVIRDTIVAIDRDSGRAIESFPKHSLAKLKQEIGAADLGTIELHIIGSSHLAYLANAEFKNKQQTDFEPIVAVLDANDGSIVAKKILKEPYPGTEFEIQPDGRGFLIMTSYNFGEFVTGKGRYAGVELFSLDTELEPRLEFGSAQGHTKLAFLSEGIDTRGWYFSDGFSKSESHILMGAHYFEDFEEGYEKAVVAPILVDRKNGDFQILESIEREFSEKDATEELYPYFLSEDGTTKHAIVPEKGVEFVQSYEWRGDSWVPKGDFLHCQAYML